MTGVTKVSKAFLRDFAQLANFFEWEADVIEEMKQAVRDSSEMREYIEELAAAHRMGYKQKKENGYIRLHAWKAVSL